MTDNNHPITPPPELVRQWARYQGFESPEVLWRQIATQAARWGADQELEACCEILRGEFNYHHIAEPLRAARRPKPPSLKELAQAELDRLIALIPSNGALAMAEPIRRALESLSE